MIEMDDKLVKKDRLRYTKNSLSASLTYLAILLDVFFFVSIYKTDVCNYYYNWLIGVSIIYNLLFLLVGFLASEGVKNYKVGYAYLLIAMGIGQFIRILIIPMRAYGASVTLAGVEYIVMGTEQFTRCVVYLCLSGFFAIAAGIIAIIRTGTLRRYEESLLEKEENRG